MTANQKRKYAEGQIELLANRIKNLKLSAKLIRLQTGTSAPLAEVEVAEQRIADIRQRLADDKVLLKYWRLKLAEVS